MRQCNICGIEKSETDFYFKNKQKSDALEVNCKVCSIERRRQWRLANPKKRKRQRDRTIVKAKQWRLLYLQGHPCVDCGEVDVTKLEFDHVRGTKKNGVYHGPASLGMREKEAQKCDIRCKKCHVARHAALRRGSFVDGKPSLHIYTSLELTMELYKRLFKIEGRLKGG